MCVSIVFSDDDIQPGKKKHGIGAGKNTATTVKDDESTSNTTQSKRTEPKEKPTERTKTSSPIDTTSIEKSDSSLIVTPTKNSKDYAYIKKNGLYEYPYININSNDSAYYAHVIKKHGWYVGVGKSISLKFANHLPFYYKLSRKNRAGQWTFIEAFDGYGNPTTTHDCNTYVTELGTDKYYSNLNESWATAVKSVCKWELIADPSGKEVIQERMLNSNGNFLFAFNPCKISDREYTGNYTDELGREISLLGSTFPNYAHIFLNKDGYEERINCTDRNGYVLKDATHGAYGVRKEYDAQGRQTKEVYLNILGEPMSKYRGQAGWERVYEKEYYDHYFIDENGKRTEEYDFSIDTTLCGYRHYLDQYGRDTLSVSIDKNGNIYEKLNGCSRDKTSYNNHGRITYSGKINKEGLPCSLWTEMYEYDKFGNVISFKMKDDTGQHFYNATSEYDSKGETLIKQLMIKVDDNSNSDTIKIYEYTRDKKGNIVQIWYDKNYQRIDSVDDKGRTICIRYYDLNKQPINNPEDSTQLWSCKKTLYNDINNHITYKWYDKDNQPYLLYGSYSKLTHFQNTDTKTHIATTKYLIEDILYEYYQSQYNDEETNVISQWHLTNSDEHARVGWFNKLFYKDVFDYTIYNKTHSEYGINEFNEPSYIIKIGDKGDGEVYYFWSNYQYYDENGKQIPDSTMSEFKASLPKAFCIEVTDTSVAYPLGLRNGDIIISYGDWTTTEDLRSNIAYFYLETILKAKEKKQITVMRHFPEQKKSKIFHYVLPEGRTSDLGFYPHKIYYTQKEKQRLLQTCAANSVSLPSLDSTERNHAVIMGVQLKGGFYETRLYHYPAYDIKDPGIVLYGKEKWNERIDTWSAIDGVEDWNNLGGLFYIENSNLWITQDLETYRHIFKSEQGYFGMRLIKVFVDSDTRKRIESLLIDNANEIGGEELVTDIKQKRGLITKEELIGNWTYWEVGNDTSSLRIDIDLQENNKALLTFRKQFEMELNSDLKVNVDYTIKFKGMTWDIQDRTLALDTSQLTHSFKVNSLEFLGENEDSVRLYNKEKSTFKKEYIKEIKDDNNLFIKLFEDSNFEITCFKEDIMYFEEFTYPLLRLDKRKK